MTRVLTLFLLVGLFGLTACSGAREQLGLNRKPPDEFAVVKRAPLALPPNYNLRPPTPGAPRPQEQTPSETAKSQLFGGASDGSGGAPFDGYSEGESALLLLLEAENADADIRSKVDAESLEIDESQKPVAQRLLGIVRDEEPPASVVDAPKEAARIQDNIQSGKPVTEGETPSVTQ